MQQFQVGLGKRLEAADLLVLKVCKSGGLRECAKSAAVAEANGVGLLGSGLTEKANDLVVAPRMKNGKMHWSRDGANAVALLRACVLNDPAAPLLPT